MVRWAILGAGNIAHRFAASLAHVENAELVAASCRTREKAEAFLAEVPRAEGARAYAGHDALLADPKVDAIYLALPHQFHHEWAIKALRAGKAVLCEKPAMLTAVEMAEVAEVAHETGCLFMEAMKPRFVPLYAQVMQAAE
ncbi:MAG: Gfo/Idh/MocA family oxidoreductase, partial [Atopobiaceae bacterium]|nr:Gfo/Idh/MocA family oxidoreductase [Atopobiaceae bacterium]